MNPEEKVDLIFVFLYMHIIFYLFVCFLICLTLYFNDVTGLTLVPRTDFVFLFFCYSKLFEQQPSSLQPPYFSTTLQLRFTLYFCLCLLLPVFLEILRLEFVLQIAIALLNNFLNKENFAIVSSFFWLVSLVFAL